MKMRNGIISNAILFLVGIICYSFIFINFPQGVVLAAHVDEDGSSGTGREMKLGSPVKAFLSPNGGRLEFIQEMDVEALNGKNIVNFAVPDNASNIQVTVQGRTIERFALYPVTLSVSTGLAELRGNIAAQKMDIEGTLLALNARIALLEGIPERSSVQEIEQLQQTMANILPQLGREKMQLQQKLEILNRELQSIPANAQTGKRVSVILADSKSPAGKVEVHYSYMLPNCGWRPLYEFNARPNEGSKDIIDVRLMAEIWQYSGMDWKDASITLVTRGQGDRTPAPLPEWVIDSVSRPEPRPVPMALKAMKARNTTGEEGDAESPNAPVMVDTQSVYASWTLVANALPEGKSRLVILSDAWNAPLEWLARPVKGDNSVFLMAKYDLPTNQAWPEGRAEYCVNGQSMGSGLFQPRSGEAILYLGVDPRVHVTMTEDNRKRGEKGFINTSKTWTWAWTFTITNGHDRPIKVLLERPMPVIVDQGVSVAYENKPEAEKNEKEHYFYWKVDVPANGKASVEHAITISSPSKLPLLPDVP